MVNRVLFLMEKFCDADPKHGPTNSECQLVGAIESTGLVSEIKRFYFDVLCQRLGKRRMAELLLEDCRLFRPDLVIYSLIEGPIGEQLNPPNEVINALRKDLGIKVYMQLWDTIGNEKHIKANRLPFADYAGIVDVFTDSRYGDDPRVVKAYPAIDSNYFYDKKLKQDIDVSFIGALRDTRLPYINFLRNNGVNVTLAGGQRQGRISWEEYSAFLNRSKISLNFCVNPYDGNSQHKARVFEATSCKSMLIEDNGSETKRLFEPGRDFVIFDSTDDLLRKVRYYLEHEDEREAIALSGYSKATTIYNARNMWAYIFEKMGFEVPESLKNDRNYQIHREKMWSSASSS